MPTKTLIERALNLLHEDELGLYLQSALLTLSAANRLGVHDDTFSFQLSRMIRTITWDMWSLETIIFRMDWHRDLRRSGTLPPELWQMLAVTDVVFFHVQLRIIQDTVAKLIGEIAGKPKQLPHSFSKLYDSLGKYEQHLQSDLAALIKAADWYPPLRAARDSIIHHRAHTTVYYDRDDDITFEIEAEAWPFVESDVLMKSNKIVRFEPYAAWLWASTQVLINDIAEIAMRDRPRLQLSQIRSPALAVLKRWSERLLSQLE